MRILGGLDQVLHLESHKFKVKGLGWALPGLSGEEPTSGSFSLLTEFSSLQLGD